MLPLRFSGRAIMRVLFLDRVGVVRVERAPEGLELRRRHRLLFLLELGADDPLDLIVRDEARTVLIHLRSQWQQRGRASTISVRIRREWVGAGRRRGKDAKEDSGYIWALACLGKEIEPARRLCLSVLVPNLLEPLVHLHGDLCAARARCTHVVTCSV